MLNALILLQTTDINKVSRRNFLNSQVLATLNSTLLDNLLMHSQPNTEALWTYLQTLIKMSSSVSVFADNYQRTITFQISGDWNLAFQIAELDFLYMSFIETIVIFPLL